jgi:excisionase family DNA binding protein
VDLTDWTRVETELRKRTSRTRRLKKAHEILVELQTKIRAHDREFTHLYRAGELVMPEEAAKHGDDLREVEQRLRNEINRLTDLLKPVDVSHRPSDDIDPTEGIPEHLAESAAITCSPDQMLSLQEVAKILNISMSKVYKMSAGRILPITKIGERALVRRAELQEWIIKRTMPKRKLK